MFEPHVLLKHNVTQETKISTELSDELFDQGYRFVRHLKNHEVDFPELYAKQQEDALVKLKNGSIPRQLAIAEGTHPYIDIQKDAISGESIFWTPVEIW